MVTHQLSIFAENKPGRLAAVTRILAMEKINIRATTIATSDTFGVINLIVDDPERAEAALSKSGMTVHLREVLAVVIPDRPGGLDALTQLIASENINVENAYGFVLESGENAIFVVEVDQIARTEEILARNGFRTLDEAALRQLNRFTT